MRSILTILGCVALMGWACAQATPPPQTLNKLKAIRELIDFRFVQLADTYWHEGHHYKTMALMFVLIEYDPTDVESYSSLGWLLDSYGHTQRAFAVYERGLRANPNRYDLYYDIGFWYHQKRQYERARGYLEKAVTFPNVPVFVWKTLAHNYEKLGELEACLRAWQKAKEIDPNDGAIEPNMQRVRRKLEEASKTNNSS